MEGKPQSGVLYPLLTTGGWDCFSDLHLPVPALLHLEEFTERGSLRLAGIRTSQEARVAYSRDGHPFWSMVASLFWLAVGEKSRTEPDCCPVPVSSAGWSNTGPGDWHAPPGNQG